MDVFANDSEVLQIGALTIENGFDGVSISGDVSIAKTNIGRTQAQMLYEFAQALMTAFEGAELPTSVDGDHMSPVMVDNPFA